MNRLAQIQMLNQMLLGETPTPPIDPSACGNDEAGQRALMRALMNVRPPKPMSVIVENLQNAILQSFLKEKGVVDAAALPACQKDSRLAFWQGDITRLKVGAIVNAANDQMLGCFVPGHHCIDNAIHSAAGMQLRNACAALMDRQADPEPTGQAKVTPAYNLPCQCVIHTVGPIVCGALREEDVAALESCYRSCLEAADEADLESIAFCCISTGVFRFPQDKAAETAVHTVGEWLDAHPQTSVEKVVFNVFKDEDWRLYDALLNQA